MLVEGDQKALPDGSCQGCHAECHLGRETWDQLPWWMLIRYKQCHCCLWAEQWQWTGEAGCSILPEDSTGGKTDCIQISKIEDKLDTNILQAICTALTGSTVLHGKTDGGVSRQSNVVDDCPTGITLRDYGEVSKVKPVPGKLAFPVGKT